MHASRMLRRQGNETGWSPCVCFMHVCHKDKDGVEVGDDGSPIPSIVCLPYKKEMPYQV